MTLILKIIFYIVAMIALWFWTGKFAGEKATGDKPANPISPMRIALIAVALSLGSGLLQPQSGPGKTSIGYFLDSFYLLERQDDSWAPMKMAIEQLKNEPSKGLYSELFFSQKVKFQYPTTSLILWDLIQRITRIPWSVYFKLTNLLSWSLLLASGLVSGLLLRNAWYKATGSKRTESRLEIWSYLCVSMGVGFFFYPLSASLCFGQIQTTLSFFAISSLLAWQTGHKKLAGILIGLCCTFKPQWIVALIWGVFRKEFGFAGMVVLVFGLFGIWGGILYGFFQYFDYLPAVQHMSRHGETYWPNQSINGLMNRLFENGNTLVFQGQSFAPYNLVIHIVTLSFAVLCLGVIFLKGRGKPQSEFDFSLVLLTLTIVSPIAWEHHYGLLLGLFAVIFPWCLANRPLGKFTPWALVLIWVLSCQNFPFLKMFPTSPMNLMMSHLFFTGVFLFGIFAFKKEKPNSAAIPEAPASI
ncbi:MAG: glycosyltransferase family 87 protein [Fibrobacteria bacterium]